MKQKITLEIQNDTGLEFEEQAEWRRPKMGEYYVGQYGNIIEQMSSPLCDEYMVITPKVDHELESAKKKFPVGSWFMCPSRDTHAVYKVSKVDRNSYLPDIILVHGGVYTCEVSLCTPFPLPTWRCCATDKPKKSGEYAMRSKGSKKIFSVKYSIATAFWDRTSVIDCPYSDFEWLDEGEL
jgi:hypothetical protein